MTRLFFFVFFYSRIYVLLQIKFQNASILSFFEGFGSDLVCAALVFLIANLSKSKIWRNSIYIFFMCFSMLNASHVLVNYSNMNIMFFKYAASESFLLGSVFSIKIFIDMSLILILSGLSAILLSRFHREDPKWLSSIRAEKKSIFLFCILTVFILICMRQYLNPSTIDWVQKNFIEENIADILISASSQINITHRQTYDKKEYQRLKEELYHKYISKQKIFNFDHSGQKRNVLLILIEGLSARLVGSEKMPYLSNLAKTNIDYLNFVSQQKQTNRGMYAVLCGDYPNMMRFDAKADYISLNDLSIPSALPFVLSKNGYKTVFMQGSHLDFMHKDKFAKCIGFKEWLGANNYPRKYARSGWGIDDKDLFNEASKKIDILSSSTKPWFLTVLTVSSHHPYFIAGEQDVTLDEILKFMDQSIEQLITNLQKKGILKNTLVLITADESSFVSVKHFNLFDANHIALIVLAPENTQPIRIKGLFSQTDIKASILDYLNIAGKDTIGRSIFGKYSKGRSLIFGNVYQKKCYYLNTKNRKLIEFHSLSNNYNVYSYDKDFSFLKGVYQPETFEDTQKIVALRKLIENKDIKPGYYSLNMINKDYRGSQMPVSNHPISAKKGEIWQWIVRCTAHDAGIIVRLQIGEPVVKKHKIDNVAGVKRIHDQQIQIPADRRREIVFQKKITRNMDLWTNVMILVRHSKTFTIDKISIRKLI